MPAGGAQGHAEMWVGSWLTVRAAQLQQIAIYFTAT